MEAVGALTGMIGAVTEHILQELLRRSLYLHRFAAEHKHVMTCTTHNKLIGTSTSLITSMDLSEELMTVLSISSDDVVDRGWVGRPWPTIVALVKGSDDLVEEALHFHLHVSTRMATHLQLAFPNTARTQWMAGALLSTNPMVAQKSANELHEHLLRAPSTIQDTIRSCSHNK